MPRSLFRVVSLAALLLCMSVLARGEDNDNDNDSAGDQDERPLANNGDAAEEHQQPWFVNVAAELGVAEYSAFRTTWADVTGNGYPDIILLGNGHRWRDEFLAANNLEELPYLTDPDADEDDENSEVQPQRGIRRADWPGEADAFERFDYDGDGVLTQAELNRAMRRHQVRLLVSKPAENNDDDDEAGHTRRFVDVTAESGLWHDAAGETRGRPHRLLLAADLNDNGHIDLYSAVYVDHENPNPRHPLPADRCAVLLNDGNGRFTVFEQALPRDDYDEDHQSANAPRGPNAFPSTVCAATLADVNGDGKLDLFTGSWYREYGASFDSFPDRLYLGLGDGRFADVTEAAGLMLDESPFDVLPTDVRENMQSFADIPEEYHERVGRHSHRPTYGVAHADWNRNGRQDLFALAYGRQWNLHWRNDGVAAPYPGTGGIPRFTEVAAQTGFDGDEIRDGVYPEWLQELWQDRYGSRRQNELPFRANGNTFTVSFGDFSGNGYFDAILGEITHGWAGPSSDVSSVLINQGEAGSFRYKREEASQLPRQHQDEHRWNQGDMSVAWFDANNNGYLDALVSSSDYPDDQRLRLFLQDPETRTLRDVTEEAGIDWPASTQISLADYNRNGAVDILVGNTHTRLPGEMREQMPLQVAVWENRLAPSSGNAFLSLTLEGKGWRDGGANRGAVGARVEVKAGGRTIVRHISGGEGHMGQQHCPRLVVGLGKVERVESLTIYWHGPAETVDTFEDLAVNQFLRIHEGGEPVAE